MSVAELFDRVVDLESRLGLQNEEKNYSERLLALLNTLDIPIGDMTEDVSQEQQSNDLEDHLSRLQEMVGREDLDTSELPDSPVEEIMAKLEGHLKD